jgi:peptidyl-tRNA hydrolase
VLSAWKEEELPVVEKRIPVFVQAILSFVTAGLNETMNRYNGK